MIPYIMGGKLVDNTYLNLIDKMSSGQPYLFLGQDFLKEEILTELYQKISNRFNLVIDETSNIYLELDDETRDIEKCLSWIQTEVDYTSIPNYVRKIAHIKWNGVITSSVEYFIDKIFQLERREVQPVYKYRSELPYNFKSKQTLHLSYLYGCLNQIQKEYRPPLSKFDLPLYKSNASILLNQIDKEFLTPLGCLVVDGYNFEDDWVKDETFFSICSKLGEEQVYYFSFKEDYLKNPYIRRLVDNKIIIPSEMSLVEFIEECEEHNLLVENDDISADDIIISVNNKRCKLAKSKYNKISRSCEILDDFSLDIEDYAETEKTTLFSEFLYDSSIRPVWYAYKYGMNIEREFEQQAYSKINALLQKGGLSRKPIIIYGQTGTGKSVSMAHLAYRIKKKGKYPVLYIDGRVSEVRYTDILEFCEWCDETKIVVFWDASTHGKEYGKYKELNDYLASKGKKAVIVGTSYNIDEKIKYNFDAEFIEAPIKIEKEAEISHFHIIYHKFMGYDLKLLWHEEYDNNFLVSLYRLMPNSNYSIRKRLLNELNVETVNLSSIVRLEESETTMMKLLRKCDIPILSEKDQKENCIVNIENIIKMVSVIGQFGIAVPFDIIFRMLEGDISYHVGVLLEKIDFLHVETDINGEISIFPRTGLEAQIVANSSYVLVEERVSLIQEIIKLVSEKELRFLVELLKAIGPNGDDATQIYAPFYPQLAASVTNLRENKGVYNEASILQETSYIREYFKDSSIEIKREFIKNLKDSQKLLKEEIKRLESKKMETGTRNIYGKMLIELSSSIGAELKFYCESNASISIIKQTYKKLDKYLNRALIYSPDAYYPIDIWAWAIDEMLQLENIDEDEKTELSGKIVSLFEKVSTENPEVVNRTDYNRRLVAIELIENAQELKEEAFERLLTKKSDAGIYLRARKYIKDISFSSQLSEEDILKMKSAIQYIQNEKFSEIVNKSTKLLFMLFRLNWMSVTREGLFFSDKRLLPFSREQWEILYNILKRITELSEDISAPIAYLLGICEFHLGIDQAAGYERLRNITDSMATRRPVLYYLASDMNQDNVPKAYSGEFKYADKDKGRSAFYITNLRKTLYYYNYEFTNRGAEKDEKFDNIHLGFSFMGLRISDIE